jgi:hypothetical protein
MTNIEYAESLELIAAFYREHPEMPQPFDTLWVFSPSREDFLRGVVTLSSGGKVTKRADDTSGIYPEYHAERVFGQITLDVKISRSLVCRLVSPAVYECPDSLLEESKEYAEAR